MTSNGTVSHPMYDPFGLLRMLAGVCLLSAGGCDNVSPTSAPPLDVSGGVPDSALDSARNGSNAGDAQEDSRGFPAPDITENAGTILESYGVIDTIAGRGSIREPGIVNWLPIYEGGPAPQAELSRPHMAIAGTGGDVYIADTEAHSIRRVDADGRIHTVAGINEPGDPGDSATRGTEAPLNLPNALWHTDDGNLYILDTANHKVRRLDPEGNLHLFYDVGDASTGRGLWVRNDAKLSYVSAGTEIKVWGKADGLRTLADDFISLGQIARAPDKSIAATDRGAHRVYRVQPDGTREVMAGNGTMTGAAEGKHALDVGLAGVRGICFHPQGGLFLATHATGKIWYMDSAGILHLFVDGDNKDTHAGDGLSIFLPGPKISEPRALSMDADDNLLIVENDHGFVRIVRGLQTH